jgi:hypothetical protein
MKNMLSLFNERIYAISAKYFGKAIQNKTEESEKCFLNLLKETPTNAAVHVGLATLSWRSGSVDP